MIRERSRCCKHFYYFFYIWSCRWRIRNGIITGKPWSSEFRRKSEIKWRPNCTECIVKSPCSILNLQNVNFKVYSHLTNLPIRNHKTSFSISQWLIAHCTFYMFIGQSEIRFKFSNSISRSLEWNKKKLPLKKTRTKTKQIINRKKKQIKIVNRKRIQNKKQRFKSI